MFHNPSYVIEGLQPFGNVRRHSLLCLNIQTARTPRSLAVTGSSLKKSTHAFEWERPDVLMVREKWFEDQLDLYFERLVLSMVRH
jgi:hypothetical protein